MYLLYRFVNSVFLILVNLTIAMYTCRRVRQSRLSLDYTNDKVSEAMKEIEGDIGKELYVTHNLTKISTQMASILKRFNALEEGVIELVRMDHNTESIKIETPTDINTEVKRIVVKAARNNNDPPHRTLTLAEPPPKTPKKSKTFLIGNDSILQNPVSKFSAAKSTIRSKSHFPEISISTSPTIVKLLSEKRHESISKTIGFRPSWKCEA